VRPDDPRLVKMLLPHAALLTKEPQIKAVRKALRKYEKELEQEGRESEADESLVPSDWPFWEYTRGKKALLVGGDRRARVVDRLRDTFEFSDVDWESGWNIRKLETLATKVNNGQVDIVLFLARFMSHTTCDFLVRACKAQGVPFLTIERGYGVSRIKYTIEQYFRSHVTE